MKTFSKLFLTLIACFLTLQLFAQKANIEDIWMSEDGRAKIQIYKAKNHKFYGKIVWMKFPEKLDVNNPDKSLSTNPIMGTVILKGFEKKSENEYTSGTLYDPKSGKTYSANIKFKGATLDIRGYVGISMIGKTTVWTKSSL